MANAPKPAPVTLDTFLEGIWRENPIFVMMLGMCPTLAVSNSVINAVAMGIATALVLVAAAAFASVTRKLIPHQVRLVTYVVVIATFVTIMDYVIHAISLDLYNALGAFIQLIVVNTLILGRVEGHASKRPLLPAVVNATGVGVGFVLGLFCLGAVRELLGNGSFAGWPVFGPDFQPWLVMMLPPGGFFVLGAWLLLLNGIKARGARRVAEKEATDGIG
ncbi:electron transporter RsxE [Sulfuricaulis limicola]|uniref:Electron transporter RsxE n=1 Tax=Sulfuricaulis limicola TaxID=1620215 RepID=A0A1B4XJB1_9GAMM|nr:electron transport complex subunit RsxE [Sulfuricaulis limicola]BAV34887.1 electron transporter RsxE [Sulfuricaulis limicola]